MCISNLEYLNYIHSIVNFPRRNLLELIPSLVLESHQLDLTNYLPNGYLHGHFKCIRHYSQRGDCLVSTREPVSKFSFHLPREQIETANILWLSATNYKLPAAANCHQHETQLGKQSVSCNFRLELMEEFLCNQTKSWLLSLFYKQGGKLLGLVLPHFMVVDTENRSVVLITITQNWKMCCPMPLY